MKAIETIHESYINGQRKQMVAQIDEYGPLFWEDYRYYLTDFLPSDQRKYFMNVTVTYHKIKAMED